MLKEDGASIFWVQTEG